MDVFSILNGCVDVAIEINKLQVIHVSILNVKNRGKQVTAILAMCQRIINLNKFLKIPPSTSVRLAACL